MLKNIALKTFQLNRNVISTQKMLLLCSTTILLTLYSCTKLVEVEGPPTSINEDNVYTNNATAIAAMTGIYGQMSKTSFGETTGDFTGLTSISLLSGLSSDELTLYNGVTAQRYIAYYKNKLISSPSQSFGSEHWPTLFNYIFRCNSVIQGVTKSNSLSEDIKKQLLGEARFTRAFCYYYLVSLYGELPLVTSTDVMKNLALVRSPVETILDFVKKELIGADSLLSTVYLNGRLEVTNERLRPTKYAALALLSRVYLQEKDYANAESVTTRVIANSTLYSLTSLNDVFLANSMEAIWQLQPVRSGFNTEDGAVFILPETGPQDVSGGGGYPVFLSEHILNSFEQNDARRANWTDSVTVGGATYFFPYKYKKGNFGDPITENLMVLRLGEQYLIRAEARAEQNNTEGAREDLNAIRNRAGLTNIDINDKLSILASIFHERQVELFTEWGHRWFDLKRSNKIDSIMATVSEGKETHWQSHQALYPLPFEDVQMAQRLNQNPGY